MQLNNTVNPADLAVTPVTVVIGESSYDAETQKRVYFDSKGRPLELTYNGTQTFDWQGNPYDSDND